METFPENLGIMRQPHIKVHHYSLLGNIFRENREKSKYNQPAECPEGEGKIQFERITNGNYK